MRFSIASGLLAAATTARAFSDSSPFVLFSTADLPSDAAGAQQLQTSARALASARALLGSCPTARYVLVAQPGAHASDLRDAASGACLAPNLCRAVAADRVRARFSVAEVVPAGGDDEADLTTEGLAAYIDGVCAQAGRAAEVETHSLPALPAAGAKRTAVMGDNDHELGQILAKYEAEGDYTAVYLASPHAAKGYEAEFAAPVQMELKRRTQQQPQGAAGGRAARRNDTARDDRPLFEKYQFFTPGIFMAFFAVFLLLSILGVGVSALASLQVPYGAFDKEMGPAAQKKQQ